MEIGLRFGKAGSIVVRLHAALERAGHRIEEEERRAEHFGETTLAALKLFQQQRGLEASGEIDAATLQALVALFLTPARPPDPSHGQVSGRLVDADGAPVAGARVRAETLRFRAQPAALGEPATTDGNGAYCISYKRVPPVSLVVVASHADGKEIARSPTVFQAAVHETVDLTTARDGLVRPESTYTTLSARVAAVLHGASLADLKVTGDVHELRFVAQAAGAIVPDLARLYLATRIAAADKLRPETLFALFSQRVPASLDAALANLGENGLDQGFVAQIRGATFTQTEDVVTRAIDAAIAGNVVPGSYADVRAAELAALGKLRLQATAARPWLRGKTPLADVLAAGKVPDDARAKIVEKVAQLGSWPRAVWRALAADKTLPPEALAQAKTTLTVGEILGGHLPLVTTVLDDLAAKRIGEVRDLARLTRADWVARIRKVDPEAALIKPMLPNETPDQRIERSAAIYTSRFQARFPTTAFAARLGGAIEKPIFAAQKEVVGFLDENPTFDLRRMRLDRYLADKEVRLSDAALTDLKRAQRLFRLHPRYDSVVALAAAGHSSSQSIYFAGRDPFVLKMKEAVGEKRAGAIFDSAAATYAATLALYTQYNLGLNNVDFAVMGPPAAPQPQQIDKLPNVQSLFGSLDFCECPDCRSVTSPAAYFVDLLQFLSHRAATGGHAVDILFGRRPDLRKTALSCANTQVAVPYIDLVNEILEEAVEPLPNLPAMRDTIGTAAERRAMPQEVRTAVYPATVGAVAFPLTLPFDLAFAQTRAFLGGMGSSRGEVMRLFRGAAAGPAEAALAADALGLGPAMTAIVTGTDGFTRWERWGLVENGNNLVHPRHPDDATKNVHGSWTEVLGRVPILLQRSGLTLRELMQVLDVAWVTGGPVELIPGTDDNGVILCDTDVMTFDGLTADVLDRLQRFVRLWRASGLTMWELDLVLAQAPHAQPVDPIIFLAQVLQLQKQLSLPVAEILAFWAPLATADITSHLGDEDEAVPSAYARIFRNATLRSWATVFPVDPAGLAGQLTDEEVAGAITSALGLRAPDIQLIADELPIAGGLSLDALSKLLRVARLASATSLQVRDLLLYIQLSAVDPFAAPAQTIEFLRRLALLQQPSLAAFDLDYLLRHQSADRSTIAFTADAIAAVLSNIRAALDKLSAADRQAAAPVQATFVQNLAAALRVTANVVGPLLDAAHLLPLAAPTIADLLARQPDGSYTYAADHFAALVNAFTRVAKGAALYSALKPTEVEFAFLVAHAADFSWLDPAGLPTAETNVSPFAAWEKLMTALRLERVKRALKPKWFDVVGGWLAAAPADRDHALADLSEALDVSTDDLTALADALGLDTVAKLRDLALLRGLADAVDWMKRWGVRGSTLVLLAVEPPTDDAARAARSTFEAQFSEPQWLTVVRPIEDELREARRDALVAYLLAPDPRAGTGFTSVEQLYGYYLIDPEMSACAVTTRLKQGAGSLQQFVQRCFLSLEPQVKVDAAVDPAWNEWKWMKHYRLWEANRKVFLYPENYLLPELRRNKSPFFAKLEKDLLQTDLDADAAEGALHTYLQSLVEVGRLVVCAEYHEVLPDGSKVLHVIARTRGTPPKYFYRTRSEQPLGHGIWSAWEKMDLDIQGEHIMAVMWNRRLHLVWVTFGEKAEPVGDVPVPTPGGSADKDTKASPPKKMWVLEFSISERRHNRWLPKRTFHEKGFISRPNLTSPITEFTFKAYEDAGNNLVINLFEWSSKDKNGDDMTTRETLGVVAQAILPSPDSPLRISEYNSLRPAHVDLSQEPSYSLVETYSGAHVTIDAPLDLKFASQDLVFEYEQFFHVVPLAQPVKVYVKQGVRTAAQLQDVALLNQIVQPRVTAPAPAMQLDSTDPFFIADPTRTFFVQPHYYTTGSPSTETDLGSTVTQWSTVYSMSAFYHPFAPTFVRELNIGGIDQLMRRTLQVDPEGVRGGPRFDFNNSYKPAGAVSGWPVEDVDFEVEGAYSLYNWELFYHAPMLIATRLMQNHRHQEAMAWLEYIFDPTDSSSAGTPQRYWRTRYFFTRTADDYKKQRIDALLALLAADKRNGIIDTELLAAIDDWRRNPFDPHRVARLRPVAYQRATVMKFIDNLIAWGDLLFGQDTLETIGEATQLYMLASMLLGPRPERVRLPASAQPQPLNWDDIANDVDAFSNVLVDVENLIPPVAPRPPAEGEAPAPLPRVIVGKGKMLYFCIPPNARLLGYWDTVADRLFKIRHCMNAAGIVRQLPLYEPEIDPLLLAKAAAAGVDLSTLGVFQPNYRFAVYLQKAVELANDTRALGALVLGALEKKDGEALSTLRSGRELDLLQRVRDIKEKQRDEADLQLSGLFKQQELVTIRRDFYRDRPFLNPEESTSLSLHASATQSNEAAVALDITAGVIYLIPIFALGASGFGGTPHVAAHWGGENLARAASAWAGVARGIAGILNEEGQRSGTLGGFRRRADDWDLQRRTADKELEQLEKTVAAAQLRSAIARLELANHDKQIENAQAVDDFLNNKYTREELYDWMLGQVATVHAQAYQLAVDLGKKANAAYKHELGVDDDFVEFGYWDGQRKGLLAAESLLFDLRRMEASYYDANARELELTKHVSLALTAPEQLVRLRQTGTCDITLDEDLFDRDHPGHYFRRLKSVAVTIPCVTGPYTGVNATLVLNGSSIRFRAALDNASVRDAGGGGTMIVTSSGQNDSGLFETNLRDERYLPFEGHGAVSQWTLSLPQADNAFDFNSVTDVVLHVRYTARAGLNPVDVRNRLLAHHGSRTILVSATHTFGDAYYRFFHPDPAAAEQRLELPLVPALFPYSSLGTVTLKHIRVVLALKHPPAVGTTAHVSVGPDPGAGNDFNLAIDAVNFGAAITDGIDVNQPAGAWLLTLAEAQVPAALGRADGAHTRLDPDKVNDILLAISYTVT